MLIRLISVPEVACLGNISNEATAPSSGTVQARQCEVHNAPTAATEPFYSVVLHGRTLPTRILLTPIIVCTGLPDDASMLVRPAGKGGELVDQ